MFCSTCSSPVTLLHSSFFKTKKSHGAKVASPCMRIAHSPAFSPSPSRKWRGKKNQQQRRQKRRVLVLGCCGDFWKQGGKATGISAGSSNEMRSSNVLVIPGYPTATRARVPHSRGAQGTGLGAGVQPFPSGDPKGIPREGKGLVAAPSWDLWGWWWGRHSPHSESSWQRDPAG